MRGGRSSPQSKNGLITTLVGMYGALSALLIREGSLNRYPNSDSCQRTRPSTAFPYGSSSSFAGLQRWPLAGSYGPWTR